MLADAERLELLVAILNPADYDFVRARGPMLEGAFRRESVRIYRQELRAVRRISRTRYRTRAATLEAAGEWRAYPLLVGGTIANFVAIQKLALAGHLFRWGLPALIDTAGNAGRVVRFVTSETES